MSKKLLYSCVAIVALLVPAPAQAGVAGATSVWGSLVNTIRIAAAMSTYPRYDGKHVRFINLATEVQETRFLRRYNSGDRQGAKQILINVMG